jgi:hypothetical protein
MKEQEIKLIKEIETIAGKKFNKIWGGDFDETLNRAYHEPNIPDEYEMVLRDMGIKIKITKIKKDLAVSN